MKPSFRSIQPVILALLAFGLVALALGGYLAPAIRIVTAPVLAAQGWLASRYQALQVVFNTPEDMVRLQQENKELKNQIADLQTEIISLKQQVVETKILSSLVDFARTNPENSYLAATVIGRDASPFMQYLIIDRGSDLGLRRGMPVVTSQGLVGRIAAVLPNAARVQLITDAGSALNVKIEPSQAAAVLAGDVTGNISLDMISKTAQVNIGDLVMTSGLGGNYPSDLVIGQVTSLRSRENEIFQRASVQPSVNFANLDIVLVITNFRSVDITPLLPTPETP